MHETTVSVMAKASELMTGADQMLQFRLKLKDSFVKMKNKIEKITKSASTKVKNKDKGRK